MNENKDKSCSKERKSKVLGVGRTSKINVPSKFGTFHKKKYIRNVPKKTLRILGHTG